MKKQKLIQKEKEVEKETKNQDQDELKIINLKKQLSEVMNKHSKKVYDLLNKILQLRKKYYSDYGLVALSKEPIIREYFGYNQLQYLFKLKYFTPRAWKMIEKHKITAGYMCLAINKTNLMQDPLTLDKFLDKIESEEIKPKEIKLMSSYDIRHSLNLPISESDKGDSIKLFVGCLFNSLGRLKERILEKGSEIPLEDKDKIREELIKIENLLK